MDWTKLDRSTWWFVATFVVPALVAGGGAIYLASVIAGQRTEIVHLGTELRACQAR